MRKFGKGKVSVSRMKEKEEKRNYGNYYPYVLEYARLYEDDKNTIHLPRHSSFMIMHTFADWGRVRHNMAESLGITTV